ncbi:Ankyrin repeat-containing protein [Cladophialophora immunda]|nr:Ankyrin repeat-containing protein [Cladophialophora immunda]
MAAAAGNIDILQGLLNMGVDLDTCNKDGNTPIMMALSENRLNAVRILLKHGAKLDFYDKFGRGTLILAACYGSTSIMEALTEVPICGIDVEAVDHDGNTARDYFEKYRIRDFDEENPDTGEDRAAFLALLASVTLEKAMWDCTHHDENEKNNLLDQVEMIETMQAASFESETALKFGNDDAASLSTESSMSNLLFQSCTLMGDVETEHVECFVDASSRINSFEV